MFASHLEEPSGNDGSDHISGQIVGVESEDGFVVLWERGEKDVELGPAAEPGSADFVREAGECAPREASHSPGVGSEDAEGTHDDTSSLGGWSEISGSVLGKSPKRVMSAAKLQSLQSEGGIGGVAEGIWSALFGAGEGEADATGAAAVSGSSVPFSWAEIAKIQPRFHRRVPMPKSRRFATSEPSAMAVPVSDALGLGLAAPVPGARGAMRAPAPVAAEPGAVNGEAVAEIMCDESLLPSPPKLIIGEMPVTTLKKMQAEIGKEAKVDIDSGAAIGGQPLELAHSDPHATKQDFGRTARRAGKKQSRVKWGPGRRKRARQKRKR